MRLYIQTILATCGFDCVTASDGVEALEFASAVGIDLIVASVAASDLNAMDLLRVVSGGVFGAVPPPVVAYSDQMLDIAGACPDAAKLTEPFAPWRLLRAVSRAFGETD